MAEQTPATTPGPAPLLARPLPRAARRRAATRPMLQLVPGSLRARPDLLRSTALQAVFLAGLATTAAPAAAQPAPAPTALPTGGQVIAGQAKIATTTAPGTAGMTITQSSKYGAYDWKSFDIGKSASVTYQVPTPQAVSVNRVISPTNPSVIAGKLTSNGVVVIQNQSGVVFSQGAEVNVSTLIASAPGISDANARAGRLIFDQPANPGARVENHGTITVAQTGLAALVAPQVANSGVIRAQMGRVVLAGAEAHTVDLYGDGLLSIDVTKQVTQAPVGPDGKAATALVTNSGTIIADGGTILLTASAVDGLVQTLVTSGGTVRADTVGQTTGRIAVNAKGGNVAVTGTIAARGTAAGTKGGRVEINAPARSVTLKAGAKVDVSGKAGGGVAAIGTTVARATGGNKVTAPTARDVVIESGARVAADATALGDGGNITLLSEGGSTVHRGELTARGGPDGGNGGFIEVSGDRFVLGGVVDVSAPAGKSGQILLDPNDLVISSADTSTGGSAPTKIGNDGFITKDGDGVTNLSVKDILGLTGNITIEAKATLTLSAALDVTSKNAIGDVTLLSGGTMTINAPLTGANAITLKNTGGNLAVNFPVTTADGKTITLNSAGSISLGATVSAGTTGVIDLNAGAGITQPGGGLVAGTLLSTNGIAGGVEFNSGTNNIVTLGAIKATGGNLSIATSAKLSVDDVVALDDGKSASIATPALSFGAAGKVTVKDGTFALAPFSGTMSLGSAAGDAAPVTTATLAGVTAGTLQLGSAAGKTATAIELNDDLDTSAFATTRLVAGAGGIALTKGTLTAVNLDIVSGGNVTDSALGLLAAASLQSSGGIAGNVALDTVAHTVGALGTIAVTGGTFALTSSLDLPVTGSVQATSIALASTKATSATAIEVTGTGALSVAAGGTIKLTTAADSGITLSGSVDASATGTLDIAVGTLGATQAGGAITAGLLTGSATGSVTLPEIANQIGGIDNLAVAGGNFILATSSEFIVSGALVATKIDITGFAPSSSAIAVSKTGTILADGAGIITLIAADPAAGGIALAGNVLAPGGAIDLTSGAGGVTQTEGIIATPTLLSTGGIGGTLSLTSAANAIASTGDITVTGGNLLLATNTALDIKGALSVGADRTLSLAVSGFNLTTGSLSAVGGTVEIAPLLPGAPMNIGKGDPAELTVPTAALAGIKSATLRLGASTASTTVADSLFVRDSFDATASATAVLRLDGGPSGISVDSLVVLKAATLDLNSAGGVNGIPGSTVVANRLQSTDGIAANVDLTDKSNAIATLGDITVTGGTIALTTSLALDIAGKVVADGATIESTAAGNAISITGSLLGTAGSTLSLTASDPTGGIAIAGSLDATSTGTLNLASGTGGSIQSGGTIAAGTLAGNTAGALTLVEIGNQIAAIGDLAVTGDAAITSAVPMTVTGTMSAANATLVGSADKAGAINVAGTLKATGTAQLLATDPAGGIALSGTVEAPTLDFNAGTAGVAQSGGNILVATVKSSGGVGGDVALASATNKIATLGPLQVTGDVTVASAVALKVAGAMEVADGKSVTLSTSAGTLEIAAAVTATGGTVTLRATDPAGTVALGATITAGTIDLQSGTGGVSQTGGNLVAGVLTSTAGIGGPTTLNSAGNAIATIGDLVVATGDFSLVGAGPLVVSGKLEAPGGTALLDITANAGTAISVPGQISANNITLIGRGAAGGMAVAGTIATPGILDISTTGGTGVAATGSLFAATLRSDLGIAGGLDARGDNAVATLGDITIAGGNFALANKAGTTLAVTKSVAVDANQSIRIEADDASITTGALSAPGGSVTLLAPTAGISLGLAAPGELTVLQTDVAAITADRLNLIASKGAITLRGNLDTTVNGASLLLLDANKGIALTAGTLAAPTLEIAAATGGATQTLGVLAAKVLTSGAGTVSGPITLDNGANTIAAITDLAATGAISVASAALTQVSGSVTATDIALAGSAAGDSLKLGATGSLALTGPGTIALTTAGTTTLAGTVNATGAGSLSLAGAGSVVQTAGAITAGTLLAPVGIGAADLNQPANTIGTLGAFNATGGLTLATSVALSAASPVAAATITLRSSAVSPAAIDIASASFATLGDGTITLETKGGIALSGTVSAGAGGTLSLAASGGGVTQTAGSLTTGTLLTVGDIAGAIDLSQANGIASLGAVSATGGITLVSTKTVAVDGLVSAGETKILSLAAPGMSFGAAGALAAKNGTVEIGPTNATATFGLGLGTPGDFALGDLANVSASLVRIGQASSTGNANQAASIALSGTVAPDATTLELISSGAITQPAGGLKVPVLNATAQSLALGTGDNTIGKLGALAITADLTIANAGALVVDGTLSAANITLSSGAASAAALDISGTLATAAGGTITLQATNAAAGGIALSGTLDATASGTIDLSAGKGGIAQSAGSLTAGTLRSANGAAGDVLLDQGGNAIGALDQFAVTGAAFTLRDSVALDITGAVSASEITIGSAGATLGLAATGSLTAPGTARLAAPNGGIALTGTVNAGVLDLSAGAGGITQPGGSITAGTLTSSNTSGNTVTLDQPGNAITALGDFTVAGAAFTLRNDTALDITGAISASAITIRAGGATLGLDAAGSLATKGTVLLDATNAAGGIELAGKIDAGTLDLSAGTGGIAQTGGTITAGTLQSSDGSAGTVALGEAGNSVANLAGFTVTGGDFRLVDASELTVAGPLVAANVTLRGDAKLATAINVTGSISADGGTITLAATNADGGLALSGTVAAPSGGVIDLSAGSAGIAQSGGSLTAGTLRSATGSTGAVVLTQAANDLATLGTFAVTGASFDLTTAGALAVNGAVQATGLTLSSLNAAITVDATGSLAAGAGTLGLQAINTDNGGLILGGLLSGTTVELAAGGKGITQPGGSLSATTLRATVTGADATLGQAGNSIALLGDTTVTGGAFTLVDSFPLTVSGTVKADAIALTNTGASLTVGAAGSLATTGGTIALTVATGAIDLVGTVDATSAGVVELTAGGNAGQSGGSITAGTLRGNVGGALTLAQPANAIGTIGALAVKGDATVTSSIALDITGAFAAANIAVTGSAAANAALSVSGTASATGTMTLATGAFGGIALTGAVTATTLDLTAGSPGIAQTGGSIAATTLRGSATGPVALDQAANAIAILGPFAVSGGAFSLNNDIALAVAGAVEAGDIALRTSATTLSLGATGSLATAGTVLLEAPNGGIALAGTIKAGVLDLFAGSGTIAQSAGSITATTLRSTGGASGDVSLTQATNQIGTLQDFASGGTFSLAGDLALTVAGAVKATDITLANTAAGTAISVTGSLATPDGGLMVLQAQNPAGGLSLGGTLTAGILDIKAGSGGIAQPGGSVTASTLAVAVTGGNATLGQAGNSVLSLGKSTITGGSLVLRVGSALDVTGTVAADAITLTSSAALPSALAVNGTLATTAGGVITLAASDTSGQINLNGTIDASSTGTVDLSAGSHVVQTAAAITAGTLRSTGGVGGDLLLDQAGNAISTIGAVVAGGTISITDTIALDVSGKVQAGRISLTNSLASASALTISGSLVAQNILLNASDASSGIRLGGALSTGSGRLDLAAGSGGVVQTGGSITASVLQSTNGVGGNVKLDQAGNAINRIDFFVVTGGTFSLVDSIPLITLGLSATSVTLRSTAADAKALDISGSLTTGSLSLTASAPTGGIALTSSLDVGGIATLTAGSGGILQSAGALKANGLSASATAGSVVLTRAENSVVDLLSSTVTGGDFTLTSSSGFTANGVVADNVTLRALAGDISTKLTGIATNGAGTISLDAAGGLSLGGALTAAGGIVDLTAGATGVTQTAAGVITAGTLRSTGGITGALQLDTAANKIATLDNLAATGNVSLTDSVALTVAGVVAGANVTLTDTAATANAIAVTGTLRTAAGGTIALAATTPGSGIALSGTVDATPTGLIDLQAGSGGITQTAGTITASTLQSNNGVAGPVALDQPANAIDVLGQFTVKAGDLALTSSRALTVAGSLDVAAGDLALTSSAAGPLALALTGPVAASGTARLVANGPDGGITLASTLKAATLDLFAGTAGVTQTAGMLDLGTLRAAGLNGAVSLAQAANTIGTVADFVTATGDITLVTATKLTVAGTLQATTGDIALTGNAAETPAITIAGTVASGTGNAMTIDTPNGGVALDAKANLAAPAGQMTINTATGIVAPGTISAGKLAVKATDAAASITLSGANTIGTLSAASLAGGIFSLNNTASLTISGNITAPLLGITTAGTLKVGDGVVITTNGATRAAQGASATLPDAEINNFSGHTVGSFLQVTSAGGAPSRIETGSITVLPFSLPQATLDFVLPTPEAGTISIGQLAGKTTDLILVSRNRGIVTGTVDVAGLLVLGTGGKSDLFGSVGGLEGQAAANKANIAPRPSADYRFNACPITSVNCVLIPVQTIPPISPLRDVPIIRDRPTQDDTDVQLPNVSDEDY